jgi:hypothetical protein
MEKARMSIATYPINRLTNLFLALCVLALLTWASVPTHAQNGNVIEYYHRALDSYFITGRANEQVALDALPNTFTRTGAEFSAGTTADTRLVRVCRFYISTATPFANTHFYGREDIDCATITNAKPIGFTDEGFDFAVNAQNADGSCPISVLQPIYRSFRAAGNARTPNHRYTTSRAEYDAMTATGWSAEGTAFCVASAKGAASINRSAFKTVVTSAQSPFAGNCDGVAQEVATILYRGAEVEPHIARHPNNEDHLLASWQQDRWSNGGAQGLGGAVSFDGGRSWRTARAPFSRCAGGSVANGGDYARATDPWSAIGADGTAYQMGLGFNGGTFAIGSASAMLVSRSEDGGLSWQKPVTLIRDDSPNLFNDKNMMVADPVDARFAYAVWGRLGADGSGPAWFSRTTDRGATWEPSRGIFDPGVGNQTFGNNLAVLSDGTLVNVFIEFLRESMGNPLGSVIVSSKIRVVRSTDRGVTWSPAIEIADFRGVGTIDPDTQNTVRDGFGIPSIAAGPNRSLHVVWQDARFNNGAYDAIAYARSDDGGLTWSAPRRINARPDVRAFTPIVNVRADGVIGVAYYDLRANTASAQTLPTVTRLTTSVDSVAWYENEIDGAFNMNTAPFARGYFVGDYFGLTSRKGAFEAFYVRTTGNVTDDHTEGVFASVPEGTLKRSTKATDTAVDASASTVSKEFRNRINANIARMIAARRHGDAK